MRCGPGTGLTPPLPLVLAASKAASWAEVLEVYNRCRDHLRGIYTPSVAELKHGLQRMPSSWAITLFYYSMIKETGTTQRPAPELVLCALRQFKRCGNVYGMRRLVDEDVNTRSVRGLQAALTMVSYVGLWEKALEMLRAHPSLARSAAERRSVIEVLASNGQWRQAMGVLRRGSHTDYAADLIRPIVRQLGVVGENERALRLVARSLAAGHELDVRLFSTLARGVLPQRGEYKATLHTAQALHLLSPTRQEAQRRSGLYSSLVQCLYAIDLYEGFSIADVVHDTNARTGAYETTLRQLSPRRPLFRLLSEVEVYRRYQGILLTLNTIYCRAINLTNWHTKPLNAIVAEAAAGRRVVLVLDTNFLLQCVMRNLSLEHFYGPMQKQWPATQQYHYATVVVPFTSVQEAHKVIWDGNLGTRQGGRTVVWMRLLSFLKQPTVYPISLSAEYPTTTFTMISKMAYSKMSANVIGDYHRDPDLRVLNVCLSLQHALRARELAAMQGFGSPEGVMLFAFMKYHVRRYNNAVKGSGSPQMLLCTMDRRLARAAAHVGVDCYPRFSDP